MKFETYHHYSADFVDSEYQPEKVDSDSRIIHLKSCGFCPYIIYEDGIEPYCREFNFGIGENPYEKIHAECKLQTPKEFIRKKGIEYCKNAIERSNK